MVEMAEKEKPQDDLSIEEILGSIRRIIAEDEEDPNAAPKEAAPMAADGPEYEDEEPLELTNKIEEDGTIVHTPVDEISLDANPIDDIAISLADDEPVAEPAPPPAPPKPQEKIAVTQEAPPMSMSQENIMPENLLSPSASIATAAVMAKLARQAAINEDGNGSITIEAMVREMLKPMLKEWLDANLPELVQKMVERELERLTKRL